MLVPYNFDVTIWEVTGTSESANGYEIKIWKRYNKKCRWYDEMKMLRRNEGDFVRSDSNFECDLFLSLRDREIKVIKGIFVSDTPVPNSRQVHMITEAGSDLPGLPPNRWCWYLE